MAESARYFVERLMLKVYQSAYIVRVEELNEEPPRQDRITDLPEWVFRSPSAIWMVDSSDPMYRRALAGEKIKKELMENFHLEGPGANRLAS